MDKLRLGWLSPTGEFSPCAAYDHAGTACYIAEKIGLSSNQYKAEDDLIGAGYVRITRYVVFFHGWGIHWDLHHTLTPEQRRFLQPYFDNADEIDVSTMMRWKQEELEAGA